MKNQKGITLIALVITIILVLLLSTIAIQTGTESYQNIKVKAFVSKMIVIQEAVDKLCSKYTVAEINQMGKDYGEETVPDKAETVLDEVIANSSNLNCWYNTVDNSTTNYRYFDSDSINTILGVKNFDIPIWINPASRNVIAVNGVEFEDKMYYRQYDLEGGQTLPEPNINVNFSLNYSVKTYDNKADIILLKNSEETVFSKVKYYKQKEGTTEYTNQTTLNNVSKITLKESGIYKVEATDFTGNIQSQEGIIITIVNKPLLVEGMTPIKYDLEGNAVEIDVNDPDWYNYSKDTKNWANAKLKDGSIYVWIPRFAYKINETDDINTTEINEEKTIDIKFLTDFSKIGTGGKIIPNTYKVAPAFQDGTNKGFANGEWDSEITGFWVAKYETIEADGKPTNILIDRQCWRTVTPSDAFDICRKMEADNKSVYFGEKVESATGEYSYGEYKTDSNNIDTHLMKNSEWGAVAYLTYSKYGMQVDKADSYYIKNSLNEGNSAVRFSSTGNYTGIYGLNGGAYDMVAAGTKFVYTDDLGNSQTCFNVENKSTKYATIYSTENILDSNNKIYGDAMKETSGWDSNEESIITQIITRGGIYSQTSGAGIFAYTNKNYNAEETVTFRPTIIIEY